VDVKRGHTLSKSSRNLSTLGKSPSLATPKTPKTPGFRAEFKAVVKEVDAGGVPENLDPFDGNIQWEKQGDAVSLAFLDKVRAFVVTESQL
jgi:hypothetical protein